MKIVRKLFVVPLANNDHGKTTLIASLLAQGVGGKAQKKGPRYLVTPWGREIDAYVFTRSFQEVEKPKYKTILNALDQNDPGWRDRELIIFPSHTLAADTQEMINTAHSANFDVICASVILRAEDKVLSSEIWQQNWGERWSIPNPKNVGQWDYQLDALGRDLWFWISKAITRH